MKKKHKLLFILYCLVAVLFLVVLLFNFLSNPRSEEKIKLWLDSYFTEHRVELKKLAEEFKVVEEIGICIDSRENNKYKDLLKETRIDCVTKFRDFNFVRLYWSNIFIRGMNDKYGFVYVYDGEYPLNMEAYTFIEKLEDGWFMVQF